jgi:hypothetical protein
MLGYTNISPAIATDILNHNTWNRDLKPGVVEAYARDMKAGNWKKNGATIVIATDRALLDGQHRLWAIIESDMTIPMIIVRDADPDCLNTIDTGKARTYADYKKLTARGTGNPISYANELAALLRLTFWYERIWPGFPSTGRSKKPTHSELDEILGSHPHMPDLVGDVASSSRTKRLGAANAIALTYCLAVETHPNEAKAWLDIIKTGEAAKNDPARFLRETLIARQLGNAPLDVPTKIVYVIKSWNAFAQGISVAQLRWAPEEPIPAIYGTKQYTGSRAAHSIIAKKRRAATTRVDKTAAAMFGKRKRRPKPAA